MEKIGKIAGLYREFQHQMCTSLETADGKGHFAREVWHNEIGSGTTAVMQKGKIIEKGAVNFSFVKGNFSSKMESILGEKAQAYAATGISSILHPFNPWMPVIHMNVRYFALDNGVSWFGGGIDLTPHIIEPADAASFHQALKNTCDQYDQSFYPRFKQWADDYFFLPHRQETRGVGGIFFDRIKPENDENFELLLDFTISLARLYPELYIGFMNKYGYKPFTSREKEWQALRRGRYVEFNLIHDRGTRFGLESGGNCESILASLPSDAAWTYNYTPEPGGYEENTLGLLRKGIDWLSFIKEST